MPSKYLVRSKVELLKSKWSQEYHDHQWTNLVISARAVRGEGWLGVDWGNDLQWCFPDLAPLLPGSHRGQLSSTTPFHRGVSTLEPAYHDCIPRATSQMMPLLV